MWILGLKRLNDLTVSVLLMLLVDVAYKIDSRVALTLLPILFCCWQLIQVIPIMI